MAKILRCPPHAGPETDVYVVKFTCTSVQKCVPLILFKDHQDSGHVSFCWLSHLKSHGISPSGRRLDKAGCIGKWQRSSKVSKLSRTPRTWAHLQNPSCVPPKNKINSDFFCGSATVPFATSAGSQACFDTRHNRFIPSLSEQTYPRRDERSQVWSTLFP